MHTKSELLGDQGITGSRKTLCEDYSSTGLGKHQAISCKISNSIKGRKFPDHLNDRQLLNEQCHRATISFSKRRPLLEQVFKIDYAVYRICTYFHCMLFLLFFSMRPMPSKTLVMSYILLFCLTASISAALKRN